MDVIDKVARRHHFRALLHEKPFANVNGSGKHCNFSMGTNTGVNLLSPGKTPRRNLSFLTFFINVIKAVHDHSELLRASIASPGNDHRLGANEAPPAIISAFIGGQLTKVLESLKADGLEKEADEAGGTIAVNAPQIPNLSKDTTDRNRTSPFAFTGNKFEFRAVGSSTNTSAPMTVLAAAVARQLQIFKTDVDARIASGKDTDKAILSALRDCLKASEAVLFEGNNYSEDWVTEAEKRDLPHVKTTPEALGAYESQKAFDLFESLGVMNQRELRARHEIMLENYTMKVQIESRLLGELAMTHVIPASNRYLNELIDSLSKLKTLDMEVETSALEESIKEISHRIGSIKSKVREMISARKAANDLSNPKDQAMAYCERVKPYFDEIRKHSDKLELLIDDSNWQLPKYRELLFLR